jgi:hypothetical protein
MMHIAAAAGEAKRARDDMTAVSRAVQSQSCTLSRVVAPKPPVSRSGGGDDDDDGRSVSTCVVCVSVCINTSKARP